MGFGVYKLMGWYKTSNNAQCLQGRPPCLSANKLAC